MANCSNCGAPLPIKSTKCAYCHTINDVDLKRKSSVIVSTHQETRICPRCNCALTTIDLSGNDSLHIERCDKCYGLFFDMGELEEYLGTAVDKASEVDHQTLTMLTNENYHMDYPIGYIKCPVCKQLMNRENYGKKSGVVVNKCSYHGLWLDSGMLNHIIGWVRAGGHELEKQHREKEYSEDLRQMALWNQKSMSADHDNPFSKEISLTEIAKIILKILR